MSSAPNIVRLRCTVVIATKNRKDELRAAIRSAVGQTAQPEVLVMDDGSGDGTVEMVRTEFPEVRLVIGEHSAGYIVRRNEGARLARGEILFSIDDDAAFSSPLVIEQTLLDFSDSRIGAVAIPYIEPRKENIVRQRARTPDKIWITNTFIGTAHALRRDLFLELGGYREHLVHQGEEGDLCVRMLSQGYFVRCGSADPIHHFESPKRDFRRMDFYGARNAILYVWQNVPWPAFPVHLLATTINVLRWSLRPRRFLRRLSGVLAGYGWCLTHFGARSPIRLSDYRLERKLRAGGPLPLCQIGL